MQATYSVVNWKRANNLQRRLIVRPNWELQLPVVRWSFGSSCCCCSSASWCQVPRIRWCLGSSFHRRNRTCCDAFAALFTTKFALRLTNLCELYYAWLQMGTGMGLGMSFGLEIRCGDVVGDGKAKGGLETKDRTDVWWALNSRSLIGSKMKKDTHRWDDQARKSIDLRHVRWNCKPA